MKQYFDRVLVTGGAGFIASHLVDELVNDGFDVTTLDNLSTGKFENIEPHLNCENFHFIRGDIRERSVAEKATRDMKIVFHLAAIASVPFSAKYPKETSEVNINGTQNLLESSIRNGVERFLYISTCAVYGDPIYLPVDEKHPTNPKSHYARTKLKAEQECIERGETQGFKTTILRLFNVYGPRQACSTYSGVISRFINQLHNDKLLIIYGDGSQTRDFIYVNDVIKAFMLALHHTKATEGQIFNIASGKQISINELAQLLIDLSGSKQRKPRHLKDRQGDVKHSYANIEKAKKTLKFNPKISLREGLSTLI